MPTSEDKDLLLDQTTPSTPDIQEDTNEYIACITAIAHTLEDCS